MKLKIFKRIKYFVIDFIAHHFLQPCDVTTRLQSEAKDRDLSLKEKLRVGSHLKFCPWCTDYGHQIDLIENAMKIKAKSPDIDEVPDQKLSDEAKDRIKNILSKDSD